MSANGWVEGISLDVIQASKLAANYLAFIKLASIRIWLRANESAP
jgi:transposase